MKTYILVFLLFPFFCLAQNSTTPATAKPSTTDCPTWKKGKKASKADYFQSLRTTKKSSPQAAYTNTNSKIQPNPDTEKRKKSNRKEDVKRSNEESSTTELPLKPKKGEKPTVDVVAKSNTSGSLKEELTNNSKSEKSSIDEVEKSLVPTVSSENEKSDIVAVAPKEDTKAESASKEKIESKKLKRKVERMSRKKTRIRKHSNSKCPSF